VSSKLAQTGEGLQESHSKEKDCPREKKPNGEENKRKQFCL